jgi:hypothetical protein
MRSGEPHKPGGAEDIAHGLANRSRIASSIAAWKRRTARRHQPELLRTDRGSEFSIRPLGKWRATEGWEKATRGGSEVAPPLLLAGPRNLAPAIGARLDLQHAGKLSVSPGPLLPSLAATPSRLQVGRPAATVHMAFTPGAGHAAACHHGRVSAIDSAIRHLVYLELAAGRRAPTAGDLAAAVGLAPAEIQAALARLANEHMLVLDASGGVRMALPFSNVETAYSVEAGATAWWANCAWDAVALVRLLGLDDACIVDRGGPGRAARTLGVVHGSLAERDGVITSPLPARRWWEDIVYT